MTDFYITTEEAGATGNTTRRQVVWLGGQVLGMRDATNRTFRYAVVVRMKRGVEQKFIDGLRKNVEAGLIAGETALLCKRIIAEFEDPGYMAPLKVVRWTDQESWSLSEDILYDHIATIDSQRAPTELPETSRT